jgi:hypothetical protein
LSFKVNRSKLKFNYGNEKFFKRMQGVVRGGLLTEGLLTDPIIGDDGVVRNVPMMDGRNYNFAAGYSPDMWGRPAGDARTEEQRAEDLGRILKIMNESWDNYPR